MEVKGSRRRPVMKLVENRSRLILRPIILKYVRPGSQVISDCWRAYDRLAHDGYIHYQVNHKRYFVHPGNGAHTQHIERACRSCKENIYTYRYRGRAFWGAYSKISGRATKYKPNEPRINRESVSVRNHIIMCHVLQTGLACVGACTRWVFQPT